MEKVREGGREGRRLVTEVRSGWGRASRSMRTKYHICQQFVVEFGRVSAVRSRVWTCVGEHRRSFGRGIERCSSCRLQNDASMAEHLGPI